MATPTDPSAHLPPRPGTLRAASGQPATPGSITPGNPNSGAASTNADTDNDIEPTPTNARGSMSSFLFMTIMLFMLTNNGGEDILVRSQYRESLRVLRHQQKNFSSWIAQEESNFTLPEPDVNCSTLAHAAMAFGVPPNPLFASYYSNVTGFAEGDATMYNLTSYLNISSSEPASQDSSQSQRPLELHAPAWTPSIPSYLYSFNKTDALERMGTWNWTASTHVQWRVLESKLELDDVKKKLAKAAADGDAEAGRLVELLEDISLLHGRVELVNPETDEELDLDMEAVHFISNGTIYGLAEPLGRHVDVRDLPSLVPSAYVNATAQAVNTELLARIKRLQEMVDSGIVEIDSSNQENPVKTTCPFTLYAQLIPTDVPLHLLRELEEEMQNPTGITTVERPEFMLNTLLISKECGIMYEMKSAEGLQSSRFWRKVTTYSSFAALVYLALLILFIRQNELSQTPLGISRLSRWTFLAQGAADSISFVGHITFGVLAEGQPSMSLVAPAFLACVLTIYEAHLSVTIHQIQAPEDNVPAAPTPRPPASSPAISPEQLSTETNPSANSATATTPAPGAALTSDAAPTPTPAPTPPTPPQPPNLVGRILQAIRENPQARLFIILLASLSLFLHILASPDLALFFAGLVYSSFWIPQIVRSARRGTSSGLKAEYLVGTMVCRGGLAIYLFGYPKNVLGVTPSPWIFLVIGFSFIQVFILILQEYIGPAFFMPKNYTHTKQYDYHPPLPVPDTEAPGHSVGDCVICMESIDVHADSPTTGGGTSSRRASLSSLPDTVKDRRKSMDKGKGKGKQRAHSRSRSKSRDRGPHRPYSTYGSGYGGYSRTVSPWLRLRLRITSYITDTYDALRSGLHAAGRSAGATRRVYALAPCGHLFHTVCLERWLAIKNLCPQCRRPLPPL